MTQTACPVLVQEIGGLAIRNARRQGLSAAHPGQMLTMAVAPASARPKATITNEARTSRTRFIWIDMTKVPFFWSGTRVPVAVSDVDNA